jgi:hypothetical protein
MTTPASQTPGPPPPGHAGVFTLAMRTVAQQQASLTSALNQAVPAPAPPLPAAPLQAPMATFTLAQVASLFQGLCPSAPLPQMPRVGGVDSHGPWTGMGASLKGKLPKSSDCLRGFITVDVIKAHSLMATVEKACTAGIPDESMNFGLPDEPTGAKVGLCLREFESIVIHCGMDHVFNIIQKDGPAINMLTEPGKLTRTKVETWINDLTTLGVWDPINQQRLPVCPHDEQNLVWSADAFEASCTPNTKRSIHFEIKDSEINGPLALFVYLFKVQRPSRAKVDAMADTVKALNLTSIPSNQIKSNLIDYFMLAKY